MNDRRNIWSDWDWLARLKIIMSLNWQIILLDKWIRSPSSSVFVWHCLLENEFSNLIQRFAQQLNFIHRNFNHDGWILIMRTKQCYDYYCYHRSWSLTQNSKEDILENGFCSYNESQWSPKQHVFIKGNTIDMSLESLFDDESRTRDWLEQDEHIITHRWTV